HVSTAPVLVPARDPYEVARPHPLLASLVLVQVSTLEHHEPNIVCVRMHPHIVSRHKLGKRAIGPFVMVPPEHSLGHAWNHCLEGCPVCGDEEQGFLCGLPLLALCQSDRAGHGEGNRYSHNHQCSFEFISLSFWYDAPLTS